ncbi:RimJ/RimL family protein N-acetyltransferase [Azospirillum brasilense]|uniref:RimJ/RimL family protein N-acetyltransferase n=1 Tax=Azospirillum brasilense TaxID=192 RepID=A0A560BP53_AZOBR|nr:GNAT family N-acetyltransferase [Azospirillum brasilense]TWA74395.1 RimJ/RimL family protein N-acetyltransferase [Azospirillum brasilense]
MDPITTERLILRPFRDGDAPDLLAYLGHPRANCFLSLKLDDLDAAAAEVDARSRSDEHIAVCLRSTGRVIGDLFQMPEPPDTHSVGWNFNAEFAGAGYATEAARAFFDHLFAARHARRLYAYVEDTNIASQCLCERLGMRKEGLFVEFISFTTDSDGAPLYENTMQYAILRTEWRA